MGDKLIEINKKDVQHLLNLYSASEVGRVPIETYIRWHQQGPDLDDLSFFCLNGDFSSGTFVVTDSKIVYADTLHESNDELLRLLLLLDYSTEYLFMSFNDRITSVIRQAIEKRHYVSHSSRPTGLLFSLQSDKNYRKRSYGSLLLKALAKKVAELGNDSYDAVSEDNIPSRTLFERLEFKVIGKANFLLTKIQ